MTNQPSDRLLTGKARSRPRTGNREDLMIKLKPCPFCGAKAEIEETVCDFCVFCSRCRVKIVTDSRTPRIAICKWNLRTKPPLNLES